MVKLFTTEGMIDTRIINDHIANQENIVIIDDIMFIILRFILFILINYVVLYHFLNSICFSEVKV